MQTIDIICPVFREEETIRFFHARLASVADKLSSNYSVRILYVLIHHATRRNRPSPKYAIPIPGLSF